MNISIFETKLVMLGWIENVNVVKGSGPIIHLGSEKNNFTQAPVTLSRHDLKLQAITCADTYLIGPSKVQKPMQ
uniref:Uncharacterized protein n=1 Tax=Magallana gigas TaxID=29159 RepID=K1RBP1_MAGGI